MVSLYPKVYRKLGLASERGDQDVTEESVCVSVWLQMCESEQSRSCPSTQYGAVDSEANRGAVGVGDAAARPRLYRKSSAPLSFHNMPAWRSRLYPIHTSFQCTFCTQDIRQGCDPLTFRKVDIYGLLTRA